MSYVPTPSEALSALVSAIPVKKQEELKPAITILQKLVEPRKNLGPGSYWQDPERREAARQAAKATWAARRQFQLSWRTSGGRMVSSDYDEIAKLVGRSPKTVQIYLSKGKGLAYFAHDDDIVTVQKL